MILSKFGKTYDTSNGSEQQQQKRPTEVTKLVSAADAAAAQQWADDGGPNNPSPPATIEAQPAWSVRSLQALNKAIQQTAARAPRRKEEDGRRTERELYRVTQELKASRTCSATDIVIRAKILERTAMVLEIHTDNMKADQLTIGGAFQMTIAHAWFSIGMALRGGSEIFRKHSGARVNVTRISADKDEKGKHEHDERYVGEVVPREDGGCVHAMSRVASITDSAS